VKDGDAVQNFAARAMQEDAASAAFNRGIWQTFSAWVRDAR
jgi:hypothetical protein